MSSGHFNYNQYRLQEMAEEIDRLILKSKTPDEYGFVRSYSKETIARFEEAAYNLRRAAQMAQRVDWLVSGDDGEESFHERWAEEVWRPREQIVSLR